MTSRLFQLFFLLLTAVGQAQDEALIDSLENDLVVRSADDTLRIITLVNLWRATRDNDLQRAKTYAKRILKESKRLSYPNGIATGYQRLGITQDYQGMVDSALTNYRRALAIYEEQGWNRLRGIMLFNVASVHLEAGTYDSAVQYLALADSLFLDGGHQLELSAVVFQRATLAREQGHFAEALEQALRSREMAVSAEDSASIIDADFEIALAYYELRAYPDAIAYFKRNLAYHTRRHEDYSAAEVMANLVSIYKSAGQVDSALYWGHRLEGLIEEHEFTSQWADLGRILGNVYEERGEYDRALQYFLLSDKYTEVTQNAAQHSQTLAFIANILRKQGRTTEAREYAKRALNIAQEREQLQHQEYAYRKLAQIERDAGRMGVALDNLWQSHHLNDSIYRIESTNRIAELTASFEREKQDLLIGRQRDRLQLLETETKVNRLQITALISGMLALLAITFLGWYFYRQRLHRQRLEQERLSEKVKGQQRELSTHALQMAQKGQLLDQLVEEIRQIKGERPNDRKKLDGLLRELSSEERIDQDWANFRTYFQGVHGDFEDQLKSIAAAKLSPREIRLATLLKMQLNNQEVGTILGVSQDSLYKAKYRLRKKLPGAREGELDAFVQAF